VQRFSLREGVNGLEIRANQGHSMQLSVDMTDLDLHTAPRYAVHGTYKKSWPLIRAGGLSRMGRRHIHFARDLPGECGVISGMRGSCDVMIWVDVHAAICAGIQFQQSSNGVILSEGVNGILSPAFFATVTDKASRRALVLAASSQPAAAPPAPANAGNAAPMDVSDGAPPPPPPSDDAKALRKAQRALGEIAALKAQQAAGVALERNQLAKLQREPDLLACVRRLSDASAASAAPDDASAAGSATAETVASDGPRVASDALAPPALAVWKDGELIATHALAIGQHTVGRSPDASLPVEHLSCSRQHATLTVSVARQLSVTDDASAQGTSLDGVRLEPRRAYALRDGARLQFGASSRTFVVRAAPPPTVGAASEPHAGAPTAIGAAASSARWTHYLVLDFEATCEKDDRRWKHEIIEFPAVLVDARTLLTIDEFRTFVRPTERPLLTTFCTQLTSITQAQVDGAAPLADAVDAFNAWLQSAVSDPSAVLPVTCGDWDLCRMLPTECQRKGLRVPSPLRRWCNLKVPFAAAVGERAPGMAGMLRSLGLPLVGRHHLGIDDSRNIASILRALVRRGATVGETARGA